MENQGTWNTPTSGGWYVNGDGNAGNLFTNTVACRSGQREPGRGQQLRHVYVPLVNNGTITTTSGVLSISNGVTGTGSFVQTNPGELQVSSGQTVRRDRTDLFPDRQRARDRGWAATGAGSVPRLVVDSGTLTGGDTITVPAGGTAALTSALLDAGVTLKNLGTVDADRPAKPEQRVEGGQPGHLEHPDDRRLVHQH